jgi:hypothetical protein
MLEKKATIPLSGLLIISAFWLISFEWVLWAILPLPIQKIQIFRIFFDAAIFSSGIILIFLGYGHRGLNRLHILAGAIIIFACAIITIIRFGADIILSFQAVFVIFRYIPLALLDYRKIYDRFLKSAKLILIIHMIIGLLQLSGLINLSVIFRNAFSSSFDELGRVGLPSAMRHDQNGLGISGVFLNTIDYAVLMVLLYFLLFWKQAANRKIQFTLLIIGLVLATKSLMSICVLLFLVLMDIESIAKRTLIVIGILMTTISFIILNFEKVSFYFANSLQYNRLGFIVNLLPRFIFDNPLNALLGIGADQLLAFKMVMNFANLPQMLVDEGSLANLRDVFWIALIVQWGVIGLGALAFMIRAIIGKPKSRRIFALILITIIFGMVNQVLEIKIYSFLLYVMIGLYREQASKRPGHQSI